MADYTLFKELRDNGFPQQEYEELIYGPEATWEMVGRMNAGLEPELFEKYAVSVPCLSTLIEECGTDFRGVEMGDWEPIKWYAKSKRDEDEIVQGDNPEEAVAKLWLALKKV